MANIVWVEFPRCEPAPDAVEQPARCTCHAVNAGERIGGHPDDGPLEQLGLGDRPLRLLRRLAAGESDCLVANRQTFDRAIAQPSIDALT
jgi:hypothetical protein